VVLGNETPSSDISLRRVGARETAHGGISHGISASGTASGGGETMDTKSKLVCVLCALTTLPAGAVTIQTVPIGNFGNPNDAATGNVFGGVASAYNIDKYDVTVAQYTAFLNAVAKTDTYGLYNPNMASNLNIAGIAQSGSSGTYTYAVIDSPDKPITYVSWGDAARFCNWLQNGQPTGAQDAETTETGAYILNGAVTDAALNAVVRVAGAKWFIPSENEWYKAAYYDPAVGHYWTYATRRNTTPTAAPPGNAANTANYDEQGTNMLFSFVNYLTDVGAYSASSSGYGTFDQTGDVIQWTETLATVGGNSFRPIRGGAYRFGQFELQASERDSALSSYEEDYLGFRVASAVPEPASWLMLATGISLCSLRRHRTTRR
jgi:formylglycine-generating enzyme required for sulfatase activity